MQTRRLGTSDVQITHPYGTWQAGKKMWVGLKMLKLPKRYGRLRLHTTIDTAEV